MLGPTCENGWESAGSGDTYTVFIPIGEPNFSLKLEGTDASGDFGASIKYVSVEGASGCGHEPPPSSVQSNSTAKTAAIDFTKEAKAIFNSMSPEEFILSENSPNPFTTQTTVTYGLPQTADVRLAVYDVLGREVATLVNARQPAGWHEAIFQADELPAGIYFVRMRAGDFAATHRMTLVH